MGRRKPLDEMLEAFMQTKDERLRLIIKGQTSRKENKLAKAAGADSRIEILIEDQPTDEHLSFVAGCDVCLSPTRWEGLGLPLYEAIAFGQPAITNDNAPMNEAVLDGVNGYLVSARSRGRPARGSPRGAPTPASWRSRSTASPTTARVPSSPPARASSATASAPGPARSRATASCFGRWHASLLMRVGVVTKWFNRGQPVVGRHTRSALDSLGHETFVLARPKKEQGPAARRASRDDVWDQPGVTEASAYDIPLAEYTEWIEREGIEAILCDQNYGFSELAELRKRGVKVIGRFVWEHFTADHVEGARSAYDVVFSMTRAEQERYRGMGLETPYVPWGCHPELDRGEARRRPTRDARDGEGVGDVRLHRVGSSGGASRWSPCSRLGRRCRASGRGLIVKAQVERSRLADAEKAAARDARIELRIADEPTRQHLETVASRGRDALARALGGPWTAALRGGGVRPAGDHQRRRADGRDHARRENGLCGLRARRRGEVGHPCARLRHRGDGAAIDRLAEDDDAPRGAAAGAAELREGERAWEHTVRGFESLLELAAP